VLPPPSAPRAAQQEALARWHSKVHADMSLYGADRTLIAAAGAPLPPPSPEQADSSRVKGSPGAFALKLPDGRWLVCRRMHGRRASINILMLLAAVAVVVAIGAFPVVRRLTRRLERLQGSVEQWGAGALSTRVAVEGRDEVASLATSFNQAAGRIEDLVAAQKSLLANASHELRSPLARIRMAVELMQEQASPAIRAELNRNIGELDQLIDEVLLASRLDAGAQGGAAHEQVDLAGIVAEECARVGAAFEAEALTVTGDARLLRRLLRNLLENARRYGADTAVEVDLRRAGGKVRLDVCDHGPGVPEEHRERIFEPFYRLPGASEAAGGVGLGLSLVRQIAEHHGGAVACVARPAGGCCFRVTLPP
jgi:signal transduction histidine kinase